MSHFVTIDTERLLLRPIRETDIAHEQAFFQTDRSAFVGGPLHPHEVWRAVASQLGHWQLRGFGPFAVEEKETGEYCGHVGPWYPTDWPEAEISWTLMPGAQGRGIGYEAAMASRDWAYASLGWRTAISLIDPDNSRSIALAERMGARRDGSFQHYRYGEMGIWRHPPPEC